MYFSCAQGPFPSLFLLSNKIPGTADKQCGTTRALRADATPGTRTASLTGASSLFYYCPIDIVGARLEQGEQHLADRIGQSVGNYRLRHLLGQGGFAEVYVGEHIHLGTQAAVKLLHTPLASTGEIDTFRQEARTIARLIHPHIVRVLDFGIDAGLPYLVLDYAPGGSLRERHPSGTQVPLATVVTYVQQIAQALQYAHDQKVIHRDIKPQNLLIGRNGEVVLSDFGISVVSESTSRQQAQSFAGTVAYSAPEQVQEHPRPASDQYALGVVIYEWLSGHQPFTGSLGDVAAKHVMVPPPSLCDQLPDLPPDVEQAVFTALAKDPKDRFASVQAFARALEQASQTALMRSRMPEPIQEAATPPPAMPTPRSGQEAPGWTPATMSPPSLASSFTSTPLAPPITSGSVPPRPHSVALRRAIVGAILLGVFLSGGAGVFLASKLLSSTATTPTPTSPPYPVISSVSQFRPTQDQAITISGSGFGTQTAYADADSNYVRIEDVTDGHWEAGYTNGVHGTPNRVTVSVSVWTDRQIVIAGFHGAYGANQHSPVCPACVFQFSTGDTVMISVWNPQSDAGPATYTLTVAT